MLTNMEHVEVLRHMKETIKAIAPSEVAALDAAIASLSAPQPPADGGFTAGDMADAAAQGFRDGVASVGETVGVEGLSADLETIWHSVSDDKETNAAYQRLKAALAQQTAAFNTAAAPTHAQGSVEQQPAAVDGVQRWADTDGPVERAHNPSRGPLGHPHGKPQR